MLRAAGLDPQVVVSGVDEDAFTADSTAELVSMLASAKANAVATALNNGDKGDNNDNAHNNGNNGDRDGVVIGCDSMLDLDGRAYGKPASPAEAIALWRQMSGTSGTLFTGHCLVSTATGRSVQGVAATTIRFGTPSDQEISAYVGTGEPLKMAGAFTIEGLGGWFVDSIDGDHNNVIGISLPLLRRLLADLGLSIPGLWSQYNFLS